LKVTTACLYLFHINFMKTKIFVMAVALTAGLTLTTTSCDKLKDALFVAFFTNALEQEFTIPVISDTTQTGAIGTLNDNFNIDSIIDAETGGQFSLADIDKITVTEARLTLLNADAGNNFANFENGSLEFNTNSQPTPLLIATGLNPDVYSEEWLLPSIANVNLKEYLTGTQLNYYVTAKARRATSHTLQCKLKVRFHIE
jgi:hypothetical protein